MPCKTGCRKHAHTPEAVIEQAVRRVEESRAVFLVTSHGPPGAGKSKWNLLLGSEIQKRLGHGPLRVADLQDQLRFKPKDFPAMAQAAPKHRAVFCDEGSGQGANRMQPMTRENVQVGIDLDACRARSQPIFWSNPWRDDLTRQVQKHVTWVFEFALDHSMVAWEAEAPDPVFGKGVPFLHQRFTMRAGTVPYLGDVYPELDKEYERLAGLHKRGQDVVAMTRRERHDARFESTMRRLLGQGQ